jgi:hypothetical protein
MLAASSDRSNVPPDHLEAAPILAFAAVSPDKFRIGWHIWRIDAQPGKARQNHTPRAEPGRLPGSVATFALDVTARSDAQAATPFITPPQGTPLAAAQTQPYRGTAQLQIAGDGEKGHKTEAAKAQHDPARQHKAA